MNVQPNEYIGAMQRLEFTKAHELSNDKLFVVQLSQAISLKRIADVLEAGFKKAAEETRAKASASTYDALFDRGHK